MLAHFDVLRQTLIMLRYWTVALDGAKVGDQAVALGAQEAILDSGTTAILVSSADAAAIHEVSSLVHVACCSHAASCPVKVCLGEESFWRMSVRPGEVHLREEAFCEATWIQLFTDRMTCRIFRECSTTRQEASTALQGAAHH